RGADWASVPAGGRGFARALHCLLVSGGVPRATIGKRALAIVGDLALHGLDQRGKRGLGVRGDGEIGRLVALEILIVALEVEVVRGDADELRAGLCGGAKLLVHLPADGVHAAPEVGQLEAGDEV